MATNCSRNDRLKPFRILRLEDSHPGLTPYEEDPLQLQVAEFLFIRQGSGIIEVDRLRHPIAENNFYFLPPGLYRRLQPAGPLEGFYLALSQEFIGLLKGSSALPFFEPGCSADEKLARITPNNAATAELEDTLRVLLREYERSSDLRQELLCAYTGIFLLYFSRHLDQGEKSLESDREQELTRKFLELVKKNFTAKKMVGDYAADLFISSNYLNQVVKRNTGFTASHHIQQRIILEAKRKAVNASFKLKEIAYALGFEDCAYFSKYFKSKCGMSFTKFKKETIRQSAAF